MIRVFLDANILFSAAWRAKNGLIRLWEMDALKLVTSAYATIEAERNLARKRPAGVARLHVLMNSIEINSALATLEDGHGLPNKDVPILAAAVASQCPILLTGDIADFGHLLGRKVQGVRVLTVNMFLTEADSAP